VTTAAQLLKGRWAARWADWVVRLEWKAEGWEASVSRQLHGETCLHSHDTRGGFLTTDEAVSWACKVMHAHGVIVMVLGAPNITLASALRFKPALEVVHA
jgi:hypothetical protein